MLKYKWIKKTAEQTDFNTLPTGTILQIMDEAEIPQGWEELPDYKGRQVLHD